jgi:hypothetical protein
MLLIILIKVYSLLDENESVGIGHYLRNGSCLAICALAYVNASYHYTTYSNPIISTLDMIDPKCSQSVL